MRANKFGTEDRLSEEEKSFSKIEQAIAEMRQKIHSGVKLGMTETKPGPPSAVVKSPTFDDQMPWATYKQQFEAAAASINGWSEAEKATVLIVSLRGQAVSVFQATQMDQSDSYNKLAKIMELRFGEKYQKSLHQVQLKSRMQKANKSLQEFHAPSTLCLSGFSK